MKTTLRILLLLILSFEINAQTDILSPIEVKEDTDILIAALKEAHPGLDIHLNQMEINDLFNQLENIKGTLTLKEYYLVLLESITAIRDGHTDLSEGKRFRESYPYLDKTLPFEFLIIKEKVYIQKDYSEEKSIPLFSEILSINGISIKEIISKFYSLTPADGNRLTFKERYNEKIFGRLFSKLIMIADKYEIEFKQPDNLILTKKVKGIKDKIIHSNQYDKVPLSFELNKDENFAVLTVNTFQYRLIMEGGIDFHKFLKKNFKALRKSKIEHLIIDLRKNYGGDNILAVSLYSYLTQGTFKAMNPSISKLKDTISVSKYSNFPNGNYPFLKTNQVKSLGNNLFEIKGGIDSKDIYDSNFIYKGPKSKPENISKNKFDGQIYCLTSGLTFSAGANFSALLNRDEKVIFIGQETGGANGSFCGGGFYTVTLPNSKFVLQIPYLKRSVAGTEAKKGGIIPDFLIDKSLNQFRKKEDTEKLKAIEIIKQSIKNTK
jgi:hypothetical protein